MTDQVFKPIRDDVRIGITRNAPRISRAGTGAKLSVGVYDLWFRHDVSFILDEFPYGEDRLGKASANVPGKYNVYELSVGSKVRVVKLGYETKIPVDRRNGVFGLKSRPDFFAGKVNGDELEKLKAIISDELGKVDLGKTFSSKGLRQLDMALLRVGVTLDQLAPFRSVAPPVSNVAGPHMRVQPSPPTR